MTGVWKNKNWVRNPEAGTETGARFSKLPVITGTIKLFCFPFQLGVSKVLKVIQ